MGTPTVNRRKLVHDLAYLIASKNYNFLLARKNQDSQMAFDQKQRRLKLKDPNHKPEKFSAFVADTLAQEAVDAALGSRNKPNLIDPIEVTELSAADNNIYLYRMHDGGRGFDYGAEIHRTAGTLSGWWCNHALLQEIWNATSDLSGKARRTRVIEFLRSAMFIHPNWNHGTHIATMVIPPGNAAPAIVGRGSWEAMKSAPSHDKPPLLGEIRIRTQIDVMDKLGIMPIPGPKQFYLPLFNDMWITSVPIVSADWPFR